MKNLTTGCGLLAIRKGHRSKDHEDYIRPQNFSGLAVLAAPLLSNQLHLPGRCCLKRWRQQSFTNNLNLEDVSWASRPVLHIFMFHLSHALWCLMSIQTCQVKSSLWLCYLNTAAGFFFENKKCAHGDSAVWPCNHKPFDCRGSRNSDRLDTSIMKNSREAAIDESAHRAPTEVSWVCCCNVTLMHVCYLIWQTYPIWLFSRSITVI